MTFAGAVVLPFLLLLRRQENVDLLGEMHLFLLTWRKEYLESAMCRVMLADSFQQSCLPKALKALFDPPPHPPDLIENASYDTLYDQ
jgi:hypothetical protein